MEIRQMASKGSSSVSHHSQPALMERHGEPYPTSKDSKSTTKVVV